MDDIFAFLIRNKIFIINYSTTLFGVIVMYIFSLDKGFTGASENIKKLLPNKKDVFYSRMDFILVIFIGSIVGTIFFSPDSTLEALAAGVGWVGALNVLTTKKIEKLNNENE